MSSSIWWVAPSSPNVIPAWEAHIFTFLFEYAIDCLIWSYTLPVEKFANVPVKGIFPPVASPAASPIIFASAIPVWKNLSGFSFANSFIFNEPVRSAHNATTFSLDLPSSVRPSPKPDLVSLFPWFI